MSSEIIQKIRDIVSDALGEDCIRKYGGAPTGIAGLSDEELTALSDLRVAAFFETLMDEDLEREFSGRARATAGEMLSEVAKRAEAAVSEEEKQPHMSRKLVMLSRSLHELKRTGMQGFGSVNKELLLRLDEMVVRAAMETDVAGGDSWRVQHAAMEVLMKEPLSRVISEGRGKRRREYCLGGEWFESVMRRWAESLRESGEWTDCASEVEAMGRICLFEKDFGSVEGVSNIDIMERAYGYYAGSTVGDGAVSSCIGGGNILNVNDMADGKACSRADVSASNESFALTLETLENRYYALTHQWRRTPAKKEVKDIMNAAEALRGGLCQRAALLRLDSLILRSADKILDLEDEG